MAINYKLPIIATVKTAWRQVKGHKATLWGAYAWMGLVLLILSVTSTVIDTFELQIFNSLSEFLKGLTPFLAALFAFGLLWLGLRIAKGNPVTAAMVFYPMKRARLILKLVGYWFLCFVILLPFIFAISCLAVLTYNSSEFAFETPGYLIFFAIIPAWISFYLMIRIRLGWAVILDKGVNPWQALKVSFKLTQNNFWRLLGLYLINLGIFSISALPLGIGLIWSLPYALICYGVTYQKLQEGQKPK